MAAFVRDQFNIDSGYVTYGPKRRFVARFRLRSSKAKGFATFLTKNFTVDEYFSRHDAGETPIGIAQSKGYLQPHIKKWLKDGGYEVSVAGYEEYLADRVIKIKEILNEVP